MASILPSDEKVLAPETHQSLASTHDVETAGTPQWDQDVAMAIVGEHAHAIDPVVEARAINKIDRFMIPAMIIGYGFVYYDKVCITTLSINLSNQHADVLGYSRFCSSFRHDNGPLSQCGQYPCNPSYD